MRRTIVRIDKNFIIGLLQEGKESHFKVVKGIPKNSKVVSIYYHPRHEAFYVVVDLPDGIVALDEIDCVVEEII